MVICLSYMKHFKNRKLDPKKSDNFIELKNKNFVKEKNLILKRMNY